MEANKKKILDIASGKFYEEVNVHRKGLINNLDSIISDATNKESYVNAHIEMNRLNSIIYNLIIISAISLSCFSLILATSVISRIVETKNKIISMGKASADDLKKGFEQIASSNSDSSLKYFKKVKNETKLAKDELSSIRPLTASLSILPGTKDYNKTGKAMFDSFNNISSIGLEITEMSKIIEKEKNNTDANYQKNILSHYKVIQDEFLKLKSNINNIDSSILPEEYKNTLENIKQLMPAIDQCLKNSSDFIAEMPDILGFHEQKNYLLLLENNNELRGGGGFIGSFGIISLEKGSIKQFTIRDVYSMDKPYAEAVAQGKEAYMAPPSPMDPKSTGTWALRDSTINPDFGVSAKKAISFYKKELPYSNNKDLPQNISGAIGITPTVLEDIISVTGNIKIDEYGIELSPSNILETLQLEVEQGKDKKNSGNPKAILETLKQRLLERLSSLKQADYQNIAGKALKNLDQKQILLYSQNDKFQDVINKYGWSGELYQNKEAEDYLMIVNNNFGGGKSSLKVNEDVEQKITLAEDGTITKKLTITRKHTSDYQFKYIDPWNGQEMWLVGDNNNYTKIYTPNGSKIISSEGFDSNIVTLSENNKTVFGASLSVKPKQTKTASITYELPFKTPPKMLLVYMEKQPGALPDNIKTYIENNSSTEIKYKGGSIPYTLEALLSTNKYMVFTTKK